LSGDNFTQFIFKDLVDEKSFDIHLSFLFDEIRKGTCVNTTKPGAMASEVTFCDLNAQPGDFCEGKQPQLLFDVKEAPKSIDDGNGSNFYVYLVVILIVLVIGCFAFNYYKKRKQ